ncbi:474_t:CDS:2, partial [Paraglomus occultum]
ASPRELQLSYLHQHENELDLRLYGTVISELSGQVCRTFQVRFEALGDGNVTADILGGNLRYEGPTVSNTSRNVSTTIEQSTAYEEMSDGSGSSSEEEQVDDTSEVDLTAAETVAFTGEHHGNAHSLWLHLLSN